jgi:hypothetical protein
MDASDVASLTRDEDDVRHDTRDGDHDDTFSLLDRLLEDLPEVVERFVLPALDPTALALLARVRRDWHAVVVSSGLPCAGITEGAPLRVTEFCGTVDRLAWAKANGCPWNERTCALAARGGQIELLKWARMPDCPWNERTCASAAVGGHLAVADVGAGAPLPVGRVYVCSCRCEGAPGRVDVGAGARLPVERVDVCICRKTRAPGRADVGTKAPLPVEREHVCTCRCGGTPGRADVGSGPTPAVPVGRSHLQVCRALSPSRIAAVGNETRRPCPPIAYTVVRAPVARRAPCHGSP